MRARSTKIVICVVILGLALGIVAMRQSQAPGYERYCTALAASHGETSHEFAVRCER
jgi:hypothetical protein